MLRKKAWLEPHLFSEAFVRRPTEKGLSVCYDCTADQCMAISGLRLTYGSAGLSVKSALDLGLVVSADSSNHAEILGVPSKEEDSKRAEYLADQLAKVARIVDRLTRKSAAIPQHPS
jgi:hypothetical protein